MDFLDYGFFLFFVLSLAVAGGTAWTIKEMVKIYKKTTDIADRSSLKEMIWCKGSHGFHFALGIIPMYMMLYGDHVLGMWGMLLVAIAASFMHVQALLVLLGGKIQRAIKRAKENVIEDDKEDLILLALKDLQDRMTNLEQPKA